MPTNTKNKHTTVAVSNEVKQMLDESCPENLHKQQWVEQVIRLGLRRAKLRRRISHTPSAIAS